MFVTYLRYLLFFQRLYITWKKAKPFLSKTQNEQIIQLFDNFQNALLKKNYSTLESLYPSLKKLKNLKSNISLSKKIKDNFLGLAVAIIIVFGLIRPMWFELYQIPSGSMRPTLKELDRITVSKTQFGINIPFTAGHFAFFPDLVTRNSICIFTGENMDISQGMTDYFYFFRGYKQYIKRMIGKPEDIIYFYGGKIYGLDKDGNSLYKELNINSLSSIDHIPFLNFEGQVKPKGKNSQGVFSPVYYYQSGLPVLKMQAIGNSVKSEILYSNGHLIQDYYQLFGFEHFGISRIVKKDKYYLEILHHPSINGAKVQPDLFKRLIPTLQFSKSYLPLESHHLEEIFRNLYTARFTVKNGLMKRSSQDMPPLEESYSNIYPKLIGIPDGTYEFQYGKVYQIHAQGISTILPDNHPLTVFSPEKAAFFYNFGIEFDVNYGPESPYKIFPSRYAYYYLGDLYLLGSKIFSKDDLTLKNFISSELTRTSKNNNFIPFIDNQPPMDINGDILAEHIEKYGLRIPKNFYYVLGDNHAMSADSRRFGFVPENNLRGVARLLFWPPGDRFGFLPQSNYPIFVLPRCIIWALALLGYIINKKFFNKKERFPFNFRD